MEMDRQSESSGPSLLRMCPIIRETFGKNYTYTTAKSFVYCEMICIVPGPEVLRIMLSAVVFNMTEIKKCLVFFLSNCSSIHMFRNKKIRPSAHSKNK